MKKKFKSGPVLDRLKTHYRMAEDAELARHLGVSQQILNNWKHDRNRLDFAQIIQACPDVDLNWLFRGVPLDAKERAEIEELRARVEALESASVPQGAAKERKPKGGK